METGVSYAKLDPDTDARFLSLRRDLGVTSFGLNQICSAPASAGASTVTPRRRRSTSSSRARSRCAWRARPASSGKGELARVAPGVRRQLANRDPGEDVLLLALGGAGEHIGRDGEAFTAWDQEHGAPPQEVPEPGDEPI